MAIKLLTYDKMAQCETLVIGVFSDKKMNVTGLPKHAEALLQRLQTLGDIAGKSGEIHVLYPEGPGPRRLIVCGLGESVRLGSAEISKALGRAVKRAQALKAKDAALAVDTFAGKLLTPERMAETAALTGVLAMYQYQEMKSLPALGDRVTFPRLYLVSRNPAAISRAADAGEVIGEAVNYARTLANRPGNKLYPQKLAEEARALARRHAQLGVSVMLSAQLAKTGFGALTAVGGGSAHPPVLIELKYRGGKLKDAPVVLVGKGITFDAGGISLKPPAKMEDMKFDMSGGAAVLGIFKAVAELRLPVNLVGIIPAAENLPSGSACRPGDVVKSLSGQTIEIINTDAEGRLILADALTYALRHKPAQIIDMATLTGAVVVALGNAASGLISNHEALAAELQAAGELSGERTWRLPLWDEYRELLKSEVADMSNMGSKPGAGTVVGAAFLEKFVEATPWAHLDIAGTAYGDAGPVFAKGATGAGIRLLVQWLRQRKA
ncbi:MAG: leucyl aminopeptidase [Candidatus Firestonebacteria bacterium]|nr:leucyl aminopeptidase [Candidatus Firestonebacteria bacterium]